MKRSLIAVAACLVAACSTPDHAIGPRAPFAAIHTHPMQTYIVQLVPSANPHAVAASVGVSPVYVYQHAIVGFAAPMSEQAADALWNNPLVISVELSGIATVSATASWGIDRIDQRALPLDGSYVAFGDGTGVHAYIIDTGIHLTHQEFGGRASFMASFIPDDGWNGDDCYGHGTHVSGTVAGATTGVANATQLHDVRVLNCGGSGTWEQVIAGVDLVAAQRQLPCVVNMSLGGSYMQAVNDAVQGMIDAGCVVAVASGNSSQDAQFSSPASSPNALTVNATELTVPTNGEPAYDQRAWFSNYGAITDLYAPGVNIVSAMSNGTIGRCDNCYASWSGTSMATPHVAGIASSLLGHQPTLAPSQVNAMIVAAATRELIIGNPSGTPNLLLYAIVDGSPPAPPPPPPPTDDASFATTCAVFICTFTPVSSGTLAFGDGTSTATVGGVAVLHQYAPRRKYTVTHTVGTAVAVRLLNCNPRKCIAQ